MQCDSDTIEFDIGVLMGSQSPSVFDEYVAMHQGAQRLRAFLKKQCDCGDPDCFRRGFQHIAENVHEDRDLMMAFLDRLKGFDALSEEELDAALDDLYSRAGAKYGDVERP